MSDGNGLIQRLINRVTTQEDDSISVAVRDYGEVYPISTISRSYGWGPTPQDHFQFVAKTTVSRNTAWRYASEVDIEVSCGGKSTVVPAEVSPMVERSNTVTIALKTDDTKLNNEQITELVEVLTNGR